MNNLPDNVLYEELPPEPEDDALLADYFETHYDVDWDEIIATTEEDFWAGHFFNPDDYPNDEALIEEMERILDGVGEEVIRERARREIAAVCPLDASR